MSPSHDLDRWATWRELQAQPAIWRDWASGFDPAPLRDWIAALDIDEVWFCGAGSSAYIGEIAAAGLDRAGGPRFRAVPTTDIVSQPQMVRDRRALFVNFGRSGNSAETLGTLDALDALAPTAPRLNITCNANSALALRAGQGDCRVVCLPAATHDAGFAMTSSFSTMLLTALAIFDPAAGVAPLPVLATALDAVLPTFAAQAGSLSLPERIVFLGSGALTFAAREAALKVMELTAGRVAALWDSSLGFRHGPKSFVQNDTTIVLFRSAEPQAALYEADLVAELAAQFPQVPLLTLGHHADVALPDGLGSAWSAPLFVAFAQVLGVIWSQRMGLDVDDPFAGLGTLTRVVSGVRLYEVAP